MNHTATLDLKAKPASANDSAVRFSPFAMKSYGMSHPGRKRESNEDRFAIVELARSMLVHHTNLPQSKTTFSFNRGHIFLVADGVGGNLAGEVASGLSVETIENFLLNTLKRFSNLQAHEEQAALISLQQALVQADARIFEESSKHPEWRGMGTTLTMALAVSWRLFVAHAGDSRCYLHSGGKLHQLTRDHTILAEMVRRGLVAPDRQATHPFRHIVTNVLGGSDPGVKVELHRLDLQPGDGLLLCSDGLTDMIPEPRILEILEQTSEPRQACDRLIVEANECGGKDNITAIVARVES